MAHHHLRWPRVAKLAVVLLAGMLLLVGQSVWAAGYRPNRHMLWQPSDHRATLAAPGRLRADADSLQEAAAPPAGADRARPSGERQHSNSKEEGPGGDAGQPPADAPANAPAAKAGAKEGSTRPSAAAAAAAAVQSDADADTSLSSRSRHGVRDSDGGEDEEILQERRSKAETRRQQRPQQGDQPLSLQEQEQDEEQEQEQEQEQREQEQQRQQEQDPPPTAKASEAQAAAAAGRPAAAPDGAAAGAAPQATAGGDGVAVGDVVGGGRSGGSGAGAGGGHGATKPVPNMPYDLDQLPDLAALLAAHQRWQERVLADKRRGVPGIKVETGQGHGLGNRVPGIVTGYVLALLLGRVFLLQSTVLEYWRLPLPCVWQDYESLYEGVDQCALGHFTKFVNADLKFCGGPTDSRTAPLIAQNSQFDYMVPMFQINPSLRPYFDKFFPDGEVFHPLAAHLFHPTQVLQAAMRPYEQRSAACLVGMHLRTTKPGTGARVEQFAAIARALMGARPGNVFVAADADVFEAMRAALPGRAVWWSNSSAQELRGGAKTAAGNPGTELSAMLDLMLLSRCKAVVLTPSSSIGGVAAGIAGVAPVYATNGDHKQPYTNPWFWRATNSEPCFVKACEAHTSDAPLAKRFREEHPLFVQHNQCHFEHHTLGYPAPTWACTAEACREY